MTFLTAFLAGWVFLGAPPVYLGSRRLDGRERTEMEKSWYCFLLLLYCFCATTNSSTTKNNYNNTYNYSSHVFVCGCWRAGDGAAATTGSDVARRRRPGGKSQRKGCSKWSWGRKMPGVHDEDGSAAGKGEKGEEARKERERKGVEEGVICMENEKL